MAKSFLGAQLEEIPRLIDKIGPSLRKLAQVNEQVLSRNMGVMDPGGASGSPGGGGSGLLDASGRPISPPAGAMGRSGSSSIEEFLRLAAERSAAENNRAGGGPGGRGGSGGGAMLAAPVQATEWEKAAAKALGESVEYLRKLMDAAKWAGISPQTVIRSPKGQRDALIAAYEAYVESTTAGSASTKGANRVGADRLPPDITGGAAGAGETAYGALVRHTGSSSQPSSQPSAMSSSLAASKVASTPTAGDRMVVGAVEGVTKAIDKLSAKLDTGGSLAFRTKGL